jgi:hypothetical protein
LELGMNAPAVNSTVVALRFSFTITLDRPELSHKLIRTRYGPSAVRRVG